MPKGTPKNKINKSEWIRSQPATLAVKDVVEKAKEAGIKLSPAMIYTVRSAAAKRKAPSAAPAAKAKSAAKPGPKPKVKTAGKAKSNENKINKSEWIRKQPAALTAKEVVEKAAKEGIELTAAQVYTARSTGPKNNTAKAPKFSPTTTAIVTVGSGAKLRVELAKMIARVGTEESQVVLNRVVEQVAAGQV